MTKILEELHQELHKNKEDQDQAKILELITQAQDRDLSQTIRLELPNILQTDYTALRLAAYYGNTAAIAALVDLKADVNQANKNGETPLHIATLNGHADAVKALIKLGAQVNQADKNNWTPLLIAAEKGHVNAIKVLIESEKIDVNQANKNGETPLYIAAFNGRTNAIKALIELGAQVNQANKNGETPLYIAAFNGRTDAIKALIELGKADVNQADKNGVTPLHIAAQNVSTEAIKALIELGKADVNQADNGGWTPLHIAAEKGHADAIKELITSGKAAVNQTNNYGKTPLYIATLLGRTDAVKLLLENATNYDTLDTTNPIIAKIAKIDQTKKVYDSDLSIAPAEINENYLKYLCKQSGIPQHLLTIAQDKPNSQAYLDIVKKFQTTAEDIKNDLSVVIAALLSYDNEFDFPSIVSFDLLSHTGFKNDECHNKTLKSYEEKPYLMPENFLNSLNDDKNFNEILTILVRNEKQADEFFSTTKNWILPRGEQYYLLQKLKKEYDDFHSSAKATLIQQHQELLQIKKELSQTKKELSQNNQTIAELFKLSKETAEQKESRIAKEALEAVGKETGQKRITDFFSKQSQPETTQSCHPATGSKIKRNDDKGRDYMPTRAPALV